MENWVIQLLSLVAAFIVGVLTNLATPSIKSFFQRSSLSFTKRRVESITAEYKRNKEYKENTSKLAVQSMKLMAEGLRRLTLLIALSSIIIVAGIRIGFTDATFNFILYLTAVLAGYVSSKFDDIEAGIKEAGNFGKYKEKTIKRLKRWGGNPEDLDKEETEK
jgi:hypothetical protein